MVERSNRIDNEEFYQLLRGVVIDDVKVLIEKIKEWEHYYNYDRPHGGLGGKTPYERLRQKQSMSDPRASRKRHMHTSLVRWPGLEPGTG
jgi:transposase InsO family protein